MRPRGAPLEARGAGLSVGAGWSPGAARADAAISSRAAGRDRNFSIGKNILKVVSGDGNARSISLTWPSKRRYSRRNDPNVAVLWFCSQVIHMSYDYDLFVIGAGSGGVRASRIAAGYGARVGICEDYRVGGTCVIRGCVPKKLLVYGSKFAHEFEDSLAYGWAYGEATHSWATLRDNVQKEVDRLNAVYIRLLEGPGVKIHMGRGRLMDRHTVQIGGETVTADKILICTGGRPEVPPIPGHEFAITSNEAFHLPDPLPN